jgi:hypothetical protein
MTCRSPAESYFRAGQLRAEVAELRRRLGRNSRNSSMPPSSDDLPGQVPPRREPRAGRGRKRGKQPGAPGAAMSWAQPDEIVDHRPAGACDGCGPDRASAADLGMARSFQQLEVPLMTARRIQHDLHQARCGCGKIHVTGRPEGVPGLGGVHRPESARPGRLPGRLPARAHRAARKPDLRNADRDRRQDAKPTAREPAWDAGADLAAGKASAVTMMVFFIARLMRTAVGDAPSRVQRSFWRGPDGCPST